MRGIYVALALSVALFAIPRSATASDPVIVETPAEFAASLTSRKGGDVIVLRKGQFGALKIEGAVFDKPVVVRSEDVQAPATVEYLTISNSANIRFENILFRAESAKSANGFLIEVNQSRDIWITGSAFSSIVQGDSASGGIRATASHWLTISDCRFVDLSRGVVASDGEGLTVSHNLMRSLLNVGVVFVGIKNATIEANRIEEFQSSPGSGTYFIRSWVGDAASASGDVKIVNNVMLQNAAGAVHGIVLDGSKQNEFRGIAIAGNVIRVSSPHGITISYARQVTVLDNIVHDSADSIYNATIRLSDVEAGTVEGNVAVAYGFVRNRAIQSRNNQPLPRLNKITRQRVIDRVDQQLQGQNMTLPVHANKTLSVEQRRAGPQTR